MPTHLELLAIQASVDDQGRLAGVDGITIASTADGAALWIGAAVPAPVAAELRAVFDRTSDPVPALEPYRRILEARGTTMRVSAGPSWLVPDAVHFASSLHIERSDAPYSAALRDANPGNWHAVEWDELLDGRLGPWTIALDGARVVSLCHTPGTLTPRGAECGVWTHPDARGRGHAAAVTAAWAHILRPSGRYLFYATDADNRSSQRVAERLALEPIGWTWQLRPAISPAGDGFHPLSALRRR